MAERVETPAWWLDPWAYPTDNPWPGVSPVDVQQLVRPWTESGAASWPSQAGPEAGPGLGAALEGYGGGSRGGGGGTSWLSGLAQMSAGELGLATGAVGTGLEAFAQIVQSINAGKRARALANYNAQVTEVNAQAQAQAQEIEAQQYMRQASLARQDQILAQQAQTWREARERDKNEVILGQTRAIVAASGVLMTGSPLAVYEETARQQRLDTLAARYTTQLQVRAAGERATQAEYAAQLARYGAGERLRIGRQAAGLTRAQAEDDYALAGLTRATGTLLGGLGQYGVRAEQLETARQQVALARQPAPPGA
jgi:hypothetical protein